VQYETKSIENRFVSKCRPIYPTHGEVSDSTEIGSEGRGTYLTCGRKVGFSDSYRGSPRYISNPIRVRL